MNLKQMRSFFEIRKHKIQSAVARYTPRRGHANALTTPHECDVAIDMACCAAVAVVDYIGHGSR